MRELSRLKIKGTNDWKVLQIKNEVGNIYPVFDFSLEETVDGKRLELSTDLVDIDFAGLAEIYVNDEFQKNENVSIVTDMMKSSEVRDSNGDLTYPVSFKVYLENNDERQVRAEVRY